MSELSDQAAAERVAAIAMDGLAEFRDEFPTGVLEDVILVGVLRAPDEDGEMASHVVYYAEDDRRYIQVGILRCAVLAAEESP